MDVINLSIGEPEIPPSATSSFAPSTALRRRRLDDLRRERLRGLRSRDRSRRPDLRRRRSRSARRPSADSWRVRPDALVVASSRRYRPRASTYSSAAPNRKGQWEQTSGTSMAAPSRRRGCGCPAPAPPDVDAGAGQVGARDHGSADARKPWRNRLDDTRGRRVRRSPRADRPLAPRRPQRSRSTSLRTPGGEARVRGRWRRRRLMGRLARPPRLHRSSCLGSCDRRSAGHADDPAVASGTARAEEVSGHVVLTRAGETPHPF